MAKRRSAAPGAVPAPKADGDSGLTPLDYMLQVLRDPEASPADRKWAAEKAAPYLHPRLQTVEHGGAVTLRHEDALEDLQ
jgi:hypothetical protein